MKYCRYLCRHSFNSIVIKHMKISGLSALLKSGYVSFVRAEKPIPDGNDRGVVFVHVVPVVPVVSNHP